MGHLWCKAPERLSNPFVRAGSESCGFDPAVLQEAPIYKIGRIRKGVEEYVELRRKWGIKRGWQFPSIHLTDIQFEGILSAVNGFPSQVRQGGNDVFNFAVVLRIIRAAPVSFGLMERLFVFCGKSEAGEAGEIASQIGCRRYLIQDTEENSRHPV